MHVHHTRHHQAYTDKLNAALARAREIETSHVSSEEVVLSTIEEILGNLELIPEEVRAAVRNHGGGYINHAFFWKSLIPANSQSHISPTLLKAIESKFGSLNEFKKEFNNRATTLFGSGWVWLSLNHKTGELELESKSNQDTPLNQGNYPILGLDVWEHAYYLKYQNKRPDYITAWWNIVNWEFAAEQYEIASKKYHKKDEL